MQVSHQRDKIVQSKQAIVFLYRRTDLCKVKFVFFSYPLQ